MWKEKNENQNPSLSMRQVNDTFPKGERLVPQECNQECVFPLTKFKS